MYLGHREPGPRHGGTLQSSPGSTLANTLRHPLASEKTAHRARTGPPDFVGVGTQRSGTTWWFDLLLDHPAIRAPRGRRKEQHFFDRFGAEEMHAQDVAAYHELFRRRPGQICGEWTPRYMGDVWTGRLLRRAAPDAKLLVLLRDPIERYRSGVVHRTQRRPDRRMDLIASDAVERGRYASQLRRLYELFPRERVLVLQYERCVRDTPGEYRRTLAHLGVDPDHPPADAQQLRGSTTAPEKVALWPDLLAGLHAALDDEVAALPALAPGLDLALWPNFDG